MIATGSHAISTHPPTRKELHALIERWDAEYGEGIIKGLRRKGFSLHDAEDAKQEALRRAFQRIGGGDMPRSSVRGWLFTIASNAAKDGRKKRWREDNSWPEFGELTVASGEADPISGLCRGELSEVVRAAITKLTPTQQYVLLYNVIDDKSIAEIARSLGISEPAVSGRLVRAMNSLRKHLIEFTADGMA